MESSLPLTRWAPFQWPVVPLTSFTASGSSFKHIHCMWLSWLLRVLQSGKVSPLVLDLKKILINFLG